MTEPAVLVEREGAIARLVLNRPDQRNSMTPELLDAFGSSVAAIRAMDDVRVVVITGRGPCFSSGADFRSGVQREGGAPWQQSFAMYRPFLSVLELEVPVIGALNGHAVGGGFGLALVCDVRIAAEDAKFGANFARLGLHPGMAITSLLPALVGPSVAAELLYTAELVTGREALRMGLVNRAVPAADVASAAQSMALRIAGNAPRVLRSTKAALTAGRLASALAAARAEAYAQADSLATLDAKEGMAALLEKRDPEFCGS